MDKFLSLLPLRLRNRNGLFGLLFSLIFAIAISIVLGFFNKTSSTYIDALNILEESSFESSGYIGGYNPNNTYYRNFSYSDLYDEEESHIRSTVFMQIDNANYDGQFLTKFNGVDIEDSSLSSNEASISKNTASRYDLEVGDEVTITRFGIYEYSFSIKYIFDPYFGFEDFSLTEDRYLLILGFREDLFSSFHSYSFYTLKDYDDFSANDEHFNKFETIDWIKNEVSKYYIASFILVISLILFLDFFTARFLKQDIRLMIADGGGKAAIFRLILADSFIKYLLPYLLAGVILLIVQIPGLTFAYIPWLILTGGYLASSLFSVIYQYCKSHFLRRRIHGRKRSVENQ